MKKKKDEAGFLLKIWWLEAQDEITPMTYYFLKL